MITPPPGYLREAAALCRKAKTLFILDEIQTGLGRSGHMFAAESEGLDPDILLLAKALGGGLVSLSANICNARAWSSDFGLYHSSTFANNHLSCTVGLATLDRLLQDDRQLLKNVRAAGYYLRNALERLVRRYPRDPELRLTLGRLYLALDQGDSALGELEEAARLDPTLAPAHTLLGFEYAYRGRIARAREHWGRAHDLDPADEMSRTGLEAIQDGRDPLRAIWQAASS